MQLLAWHLPQATSKIVINDLKIKNKFRRLTGNFKPNPFLSCSFIENNRQREELSFQEGKPLLLIEKEALLTLTFETRVVSDPTENNRYHVLIRKNIQLEPLTCDVNANENYLPEHYNSSLHFFTLKQIMDIYELFLDFGEFYESNS